MAPPSTRAPFSRYQQSQGAKSVISRLIRELRKYFIQGRVGSGKSSPSHIRALCELQFHVVLSWTVIGNKCQLLASWLYPTSFSFLFLFASLILYPCFRHSLQNTIRLLIIQLSSHSSPSPEISHLDDWVGCSQALQSFTEFFLFILRYVRLNHMKLLFWQVKQSDGSNLMWFIKQQTGSTSGGLTKSNSLSQALW